MNLKRQSLLFIVQICPLLVYGTVSIASMGTQIIGNTFSLNCTILPFDGVATWAQEENVRTTCTNTFCSDYNYGNYTTFSFGSNYIEVTFDPVHSSIDGVWQCTHSTLESSNVTVSAMNKTNSPTTATTEQQTITNATIEQQTTTNATTEQQTITHATTTMGTNGGSKDTVITIYIGTGTGLGGISFVVIIMICKGRKKNTKNSQDRTGNNSGNPERVSMPNEPPVDYDTRNDRKANKQNMCV